MAGETEGPISVRSVSVGVRCSLAVLFVNFSFQTPLGDIRTQTWRDSQSEAGLSLLGV